MALKYSSPRQPESTYRLYPGRDFKLQMNAKLICTIINAEGLFICPLNVHQKFTIATDPVRNISLRAYPSGHFLICKTLWKIQHGSNLLLSFDHRTRF